MTRVTLALGDIVLEHAETVTVTDCAVIVLRARFVTCGSGIVFVAFTNGSPIGCIEGTLAMSAALAFLARRAYVTTGWAHKTVFAVALGRFVLGLSAHHDGYRFRRSYSSDMEVHSQRLTNPSCTCTSSPFQASQRSRPCRHTPNRLCQRGTTSDRSSRQHPYRTSILS